MAGKCDPSLIRKAKSEVSQATCSWMMLGRWEQGLWVGLSIQGPPQCLVNTGDSEVQGIRKQWQNDADGEARPSDKRLDDGLPSHLIYDSLFMLLVFTTQFLRLQSIPPLNSFLKGSSVNDLQYLNIIYCAVSTTQGQQPRPHLLCFTGKRKGQGIIWLMQKSEVLSRGKLLFSRFDYGIHLVKSKKKIRK